ncbi:MAG TPA: cytochrome P450 [Labilithrix sp.]|nr:cytochrome P450 [Labilithrix sp.]
MKHVSGFADVGMPPRVPGLPLLGSTLALRRQGMLPFLLSSHRAMGDVFRMRVGHKENYVIAYPDGAAHVLQQNAKNYAKSESYRRMEVMLGNGLLITEGELWRRQRSVAQPFFTRSWVDGQAGTMSSVVDARLRRWQRTLVEGKAIDIKSECRLLSLELVSHCVFGMDAAEDAVALGRATDALSHYVERQRLRLLPLPKSVPTPRNLSARYHRWCVDRAVRRFTAAPHAGEGKGLIATLLGAKNDRGEPIFDDQQVKDQIVTILVAGYETTAAAMAWTIFLLAKHPDVADRLRTEVDRVMGDRMPTVEELGRVSYLTMVLNESMRLYPPAWVVGRRAIAADSLRGYTIPAGASVGVHLFVIHRHPDYWSRPDVFDPEHFAPEAAAARPRLAFVPFGAGARTCIGHYLAMLELRLALAMFVQRFSVSVPSDYEPEPQPNVTLTPPDGMPLKLRSRHA